MPTVRVTMFEDPIKVPEDEVEVLRSQGLLRDEPATEAPPATAAAKSTPRKDTSS